MAEFQLCQYPRRLRHYMNSAEKNMETHVWRMFPCFEIWLRNVNNFNFHAVFGDFGHAFVMELLELILYLGYAFCVEYK